MFRKKICTLGAALGCCCALAAQDCRVVELRGRIVEAETRAPLAFATVFVQEARRGAVADEQGYYSIPGLCADTAYTVEVRHVECAHQTRLVRLAAGVGVDFQLVHSAVLNEIIVTEKALPPPPVQAGGTVERADLAAAQGVNLGETLKRLPGVSTLNTGATIAKPVIQGLHSNRIAIINNGLALEAQQWGAEHAPEIDPFTADKISVVKGAAGVRYGVGAMGGAVVLTPAPLRETPGWGGWLVLGGFSNGLGVAASGAADWRVPGRSLAFRLQGTLKRSGNLRAPDYWLGNTGAEECDFSVLSGWQSGPWRHEAGVSHVGQRFGILRAAHVGNLTDLQRAIDSETPLNNRDEFSYHIDRPYQLVSHNTLTYKASRPVSDIWKIGGRYAVQHNHRQEFDVVRASSSAAEKPQVDFRLWTYLLDLTLEHRPLRHWQGEMGVQAIQQFNRVGRGGFIPDYQTSGGSVWASERWRRYPDPWEFEFGARYDYRRSRATTRGSLVDLDTTVHFGNLSGTAGAMYHFSPKWSLTLHSGLAWRPPHVNELFARGVHHGAGTYEQGRADLVPEKGWNTNLTLGWQDRGAALTLTLYHNRIRDFIYLDPQNTFVLTVRGAFPAYFYAQADAVLQGLDGSLMLPVGGGFALEGRASLLRGYRMTADSADAGRRRDWLPLLPADRLQYGIRWTTSRRPANLPDGSPVSSQQPVTSLRLLATTGLRQSRIPEAGLLKDPPTAFTTLGFDAAHTFFLRKKQTLEVGLGVQNATNLRYREYLNFFRFFADEPGFGLNVRAKWIW